MCFAHVAVQHVSSCCSSSQPILESVHAAEAAEAAGESAAQSASCWAFVRDVHALAHWYACWTGAMVHGHHQQAAPAELSLDDVFLSSPDY